MNRHFNIFLRGLGFVALICISCIAVTLSIGVIVLPMVLSIEYNNNHWMWLYVPMFLGFVYWIGSDYYE